ncbi:uncharacterized protein EI90DRAFT_141938 [Cantharellus anzutake]|uniref:uncharacterized protein n=1 Tax=Cantharellus anzutake TaxID=1750568 RepID=UPI001902EEDA|nr:uncharacterized protein EI90DRAFT_141938 [Cantharellus anzutake]KAF8317770.1 hypothetical protein EI90DRAFT_141938 [Cantharellus anzutake]
MRIANLINAALVSLFYMIVGVTGARVTTPTRTLVERWGSSYTCVSLSATVLAGFVNLYSSLCICLGDGQSMEGPFPQTAILNIISDVGCCPCICMMLPPLSLFFSQTGSIVARIRTFPMLVPSWALFCYQLSCKRFTSNTNARTRLTPFLSNVMQPVISLARSAWKIVR